MGIVRILKPGLFLYECIKILLLLYTIILLSGTSSVIWLVLFTPGILFPLMALFIWLDISRYKTYLPLYLAGKCVGIFTLALWLIISSQGTIIGGIQIALLLIRSLLLSGDCFSMAAILVIIKSVKEET